jgi:hypothetical protein
MANLGRGYGRMMEGKIVYFPSLGARIPMKYFVWLSFGRKSLALRASW